MQTYIIEINEEQRLALIKLFEQAEAAKWENHDSESICLCDGCLSDSGLSDSDGPLDYWKGMLESLPVVEKESPRIIHGFCL